MINGDDIDMLAAEYVLGTLPAGERAAVATALAPGEDWPTPSRRGSVGSRRYSERSRRETSRPTCGR